MSGRGWYFDFLLLEKYLQKSTTPATPALSLLRAADRQLDHILAEGLAARVARHRRLAGMTQTWALERGFGLLAAADYRSLTVTCIENTPGINFAALNSHLKRCRMTISNGYGDLKDKTFRIAHMGDVTDEEMAELLGAMDEFLASQS